METSAPLIKHEPTLLTNPNHNPNPNPTSTSNPSPIIDLSSSDSDSEVEDEETGSGPTKRVRTSDGSDKRSKKLKALPLGFLDPLPLGNEVPSAAVKVVTGSRQFWKAGDYDGSVAVDDSLPLNVSGAGMDHVRVHPKFLHSNATSHKWALGAFAELLDNSFDEVCNGATFVNIDVMENKKDGTKMLMIEDNGGGMDPDNMRKCMSLGYSVKSKIANTIGQYGNGFKTSTMRLGADVIVFTRSQGKDGKSATQSIGMLSFTFLRNTGKEDIVVPMLDYEKTDHVWRRMARSSSVDWNINIETIVQWSPYSSETELLEQLNSVSDQGTRIVIYNLWEDDQGELELDFDTDKYDIQLGGVNRDEKNIEMATQYPNSRHFLTYRHSLRSYASILYLKVPQGFRMVLRGKEIEHHNLVNDMMLKDTVHYRPQPGGDGASKDSTVAAVVTMGFVKDAKHHIDIQGFNVYHKNRLIKPFWRVWNAAGSDGRGVIGFLEANFVEPAHDKQGFERTTVLSRLEARLVLMQKAYWSTKCHKIGYAPRRNKKQIALEERESSPEAPNSFISGKTPVRHGGSKIANKFLPCSNKMRTSGYHESPIIDDSDSDNEYIPLRKSVVTQSGRPIILPQKYSQKSSIRPSLTTSPFSVNKTAELNHVAEGVNQSARPIISPQKYSQKSSVRPSLKTSPFSVNKTAELNHVAEGVEIDEITTRSQSKVTSDTCNGSTHEDSQLRMKQLIDENETLKKRIINIEQTMTHDLQQERKKNALLTEQLEDTQKRLEEANREQEALVDVFAEERSRRDKEELNLRKKLRDASLTIQELLDKLRTSGKN